MESSMNSVISSFKQINNLRKYLPRNSNVDTISKIGNET